MVSVEGKDARAEGRGEHTYQWGHPLKEVDALPIIDVVRLPALRGTGGKRYSQVSAHGPIPSFS